MTAPSVAAGHFTRCASCATELSPALLACPSCHALVHAERLKELAATANACAARKDLHGERDAWTRAGELLPANSQQRAFVNDRLAVVCEAIARQPATASRSAAAEVTGPWWKRGWAGAVAAVLLALSKAKFLILGLLKAKTFFSMFAFFGVYWAAFGWPLALGLVLSIYIHEMGHVAELKRLGIAAGAPLFIPGIGALVRLKQRVPDPVTDARVGLAGPIWGLAAGVAAFIVARFTASPIWYAIAQLTGYINLFNLIPIWQLDGSRGFHALDRLSRWLLVGLAIAMFALTHQKLLLVVAGVGAFRALQKSDMRTHRPTLATFAVLVIALSMLSEIPVNLTR